MARYSVLERQSLPPKPEKIPKEDRRAARLALLFMFVLSVAGTIALTLAFAALRYSLVELFGMEDSHTARLISSVLLVSIPGVAGLILIFRCRDFEQSKKQLSESPFLMLQLLPTFMIVIAVYIFGAKGVLLAINWIADQEVFTQKDMSSAFSGGAVFLVVMMYALPWLFHRLRTKRAQNTEA